MIHFSPLSISSQSLPLISILMLSPCSFKVFQFGIQIIRIILFSLHLTFSVRKLPHFTELISHYLHQNNFLHTKHNF